MQAFFAYAERSIKERNYKVVFYVRLSQGKIEHPTVFLQVTQMITEQRTKNFGFATLWSIFIRVLYL
jgi:hypothetical protein